MFWGCFTYDIKGPCHIYYPETDAQKLAYGVQIEELNEKEIEAECWADFEVQEKEKEAN